MASDTYSAVICIHSSVHPSVRRSVCAAEGRTECEWERPRSPDGIPRILYKWWLWPGSTQGHVQISSYIVKHARTHAHTFISTRTHTTVPAHPPSACSYIPLIRGMYESDFGGSHPFPALLTFHAPLTCSVTTFIFFKAVPMTKPNTAEANGEGPCLFYGIPVWCCAGYYGNPNLDPFSWMKKIYTYSINCALWLKKTYDFFSISRFI